MQVNDELCEIDGVHVEKMPVQVMLSCFFPYTAPSFAVSQLSAAASDSAAMTAPATCRIHQECLLHAKVSDESVVSQAVLQRVAGPPGTLVVMNFKNHRTEQVPLALCFLFNPKRGNKFKLPKNDEKRAHKQHYDVIALRHVPIQGDRMPMPQMPMPQMAEMGRPRSATASYPEIPALGNFDLGIAELRECAARMFLFSFKSSTLHHLYTGRTSPAPRPSRTEYI